MNIATKRRLAKLERIAAGCVRSVDLGEPEIECRDDQCADEIGMDFWRKEMEGESQYLPIDENFNTAMVAWYQATKAARQQGHTEYHVGLRPYAMPIWLEMKPGILEHHQQFGEWIWDDPPTRGDLMTHKEIMALDSKERTRVIDAMNRRRGHYSKDPWSNKRSHQKGRGK
jgi:hypothetical protein